jgi:hypothetical protein
MQRVAAQSRARSPEIAAFDQGPGALRLDIPQIFAERVQFLTHQYKLAATDRRTRLRHTLN